MYKEDQLIFGRKILWWFLESRSLEFLIVREFLAILKQKFKSGDNELVEVIELKKVEQGSKTIEEFV